MKLINTSNISFKTAEKLLEKTKTYFFGEAKEDKTFRLKLDIIGEETLSADTDVTDHYVESNEAYQDQISLKPKIYTIQGEVGELVWYQKNDTEQGLGQVAQRLEGVISFLPIRSKSFNQMKTKAMKALQWVDTASNVISKINSLADDFGRGKQENAFARLCSYRDNRTVLNIKTPWGTLESYTITNLKFTQPKDTKDKTLISITFKEFRTTSLGEPVPFDSSKYQGNAVFENQPSIDNGKTSGKRETVARLATKDDKNNPFKTTGDLIDTGEEYVCPVSDGSQNLEIWYKNAKNIQIVDSESGQSIKTGTTWDNAFKACSVKIYDAVNSVPVAKGNPQ